MLPSLAKLHARRDVFDMIVHTTMIRRATIHDVPRMQEIINSHAELGKMLFKSYAQLYEQLRDFAVDEIETATGREVVGCAALTILWADLAEVRSLAVDERILGRGIGRQLVRMVCRRRPRLHQIRRIMSLTYEQTVFREAGIRSRATKTRCR